MKALIIGSSIVDLFLDIEDKSYLNISGNNVSLSLGEKIPININKTTLGGNGANVSVGLKRLSYDTDFFTYFGNDLFSKEIEEIIKKEGINLTIDRSEGKSSLSLIFALNGDRIIFTHHEKREHNFYYNNSSLPNFVYLTSIGNSWINAYQKVLEFIKTNNLPLVFTPGATQFENNPEVLFETINNSKIVLMNKEEAEKILELKGLSYEKDIKDTLAKLSSLGPKIVSVTNGTDGAYALDEEGNLLKVKAFGGEVIERTGAGDAYTSGFLAAFFSGQPISECMRWGTFNAGSVVKKIGAQEGLLTKEEMSKIVEEHKDFIAEKI